MPAVKQHIRLTNRMTDLPALAEQVETFGRLRHMSGRTLHEINLVLEELFTNIVKNGYTDDRIHVIDIHLSHDDKAFRATVVDDGLPFNPCEAEPPDTRCSLEDRSIGGVGLHLIRKLVDGLSYRRSSGKNRVTLTKQIV